MTVTTGPPRPFTTTLTPTTGDIQPAGRDNARRLSELADLFADSSRARAMAAQEDLVIYTGSTADVPEVEGEVGLATTRIEPGTVGEEFFMTHGHRHSKPQGEIYLALSGHGGLLLRRGTDVVWRGMRPGIAGHIPAGWAHRTVNIGLKPFVFVALYPRLAGHDYSPIAAEGMGARVVATRTGYRVIKDDGSELYTGALPTTPRET